jgi:2-methylcitrate dehydratase PrpD
MTKLNFRKYWIPKLGDDRMQTKTPEATRALADFISSTEMKDLPESAIRQAQWIIADTFGVALRGSIEPEVTRLYERLSTDPASIADAASNVFRKGMPKLNAPSAAFVNAASICFLELDEGSRPTGHPAIHILPALLALAQSKDKPGSSFLTAFVLGYEVQARIQRASRLRPLVHPHGNFGLVGAVAALGKLSGWSTEHIFQGLLNATAHVMATSWQPCLVGATIRNTYPAMTAQTTFMVHQLVECGFTGYEGALEETFGQILGSSFEPDELSRDLGTNYAVEQNYFKFHAACALVHPVLDSVAVALGAVYQMGEYPPIAVSTIPVPESIKHVKVSVLERSMRLNIKAYPNQLSAKFSIPYAVAAYLIRGKSDPDSFREPSLSDPQIDALQNKVEMVGDANLTALWPNQHPAAVEIHLTDGRVLTGRCENPFGSITNYPAETDLKAKFTHLGKNILPDDELDRLWSDCMSLSSKGSMAKLQFQV